MTSEQQSRQQQHQAQPSPEQIEADIERTRGDMGRTIDEIGERVSPRRAYERRKSSLLSRLQGAKRRVFGETQETYEHARQAAREAPEQMRGEIEGNPLAAGLVVFGAGLLAGSIMSETRTERDLVQRAEPQVGAAREQMMGAAREVADDVRQSAGQEAKEMGKSAAGAAGHVADETRRATEETRRQAG